jgi:hypothetical protein
MANLIKTRISAKLTHRRFPAGGKSVQNTHQVIDFNNGDTFYKNQKLVKKYPERINDVKFTS